MIFEQNRTLDLICVGRINADLNPVVFNQAMEDVEGYQISVGGSPANIAVGAARRGLRVGFIGKLSSDAMGRTILKRLKNFGVDISNITTDNMAVTSLAITEIRSANECAVVFYRDNAADLKISCADISEDYIAGAKILLISGTALARSPSREAVFLAAEYARRNGTVVVLDLDYRSKSWASQEETSIYYHLLCERCDIIIGTREEYDILEYLFKKNDESENAQSWFEKKAEIVIVKRGKEGSIAYTKGGETFQGKAFAVHERKTFGAGDAFAASFLASLLKGKSIEAAINDGALAASIVISGFDSSQAMPTEEQLQYFSEHLDELANSGMGATVGTRM